MRYLYLIVAIVLLWFCVHGIRTEEYHDQNVSLINVWRPWQLLNVHESPNRCLIVDGHSYYGVRGVNKRYLQYPSDGIVFVSETEGSPVAIYFVNLASKKVTKVDLGRTSFGWGIGSDGTHNFRDWIEPTANPGQVRAISQEGSGQLEITIDLEQGKVLKNEYIHLSGAKPTVAQP